MTNHMYVILFIVPRFLFGRRANSLEMLRLKVEKFLLPNK